MLPMWPAQPSPPRFNVVFTHHDTAEVIILRSIQDANDATIALHAERTRLIQDQMRGELQLVQQSDPMHPLLREALGGSATVPA